VYRAALDAYAQGKLTLTLKKKLLEQLRGTFNRGFSTGFYLGQASDLGAGEGVAATDKVYVGEIENYYAQINVAAVRVHAAAVSSRDTVLIYGKTTPSATVKLSRMQIDHAVVKKAGKGQLFGFKIPFPVRPKDKVFLIKSRVEENKGDRSN
jgi:putative protease